MIRFNASENEMIARARIHRHGLNLTDDNFDISDLLPLLEVMEFESQQRLAKLLAGELSKMFGRH